MQNVKVLSLTGLLMVAVALVCNYAVARVYIPPVHRLPVETFPRQIGEWTAGPDQPVDAYVQQVIPTAKIVTRNYTNASGQKLELLLLSAERSADFHDPNLCFPSHGWELSNQHLRIVNGQQVNTMVAERDGIKTAVWYWWAGEVDLEKPANQVQGQLQYLRKYIFNTYGRADGMSVFVRMMAPDTDQGYAQLEAFTRATLPLYPSLWEAAKSPKQTAKAF